MHSLKVAMSSAAIGVLFFTAQRAAEAGTITAVGAVVALNDVTQMQGTTAHGNFDEGPTSDVVPLNVYSAQGLTWQAAALSAILPGVTNTGTAAQPDYDSDVGSGFFPTPIAGGGVASGQFNDNAGVATFSVRVTQVGLTASRNGTQYLTAWDKAGALIGQVTWAPTGDAAFIGLDTQGVAIGMVSYGNHNVWSGAPYGIGGASIFSDSWIWASGLCTTNAQCDDGNVCTTDVCDPLGQCSNVANTASCDDGNACTQTDVCSSGTCTGINPVTCTALDQCHAPGSCDPTSGACTNPAAPNDSPCNDGNACTQTDGCQAGVCTGSNAVTCTPSDGCHIGGTCDPTTGGCSNPPAADGMACTTSNLCVPAATCLAGVCSGAPILCPPQDQCHGQGLCDASSGLCSHPALADGTVCNDGNPCTQVDVCIAGACTGENAVTCTATDQCHAPGSCDPTTGVCTNPTAMDGSSCSDGDACTTGDACQAGFCKGSNPVTCTASDACHGAGTCNPTTGICSKPAQPDGTSCSDGNPCTLADQCTAGVCKGESVACTALDNCHAAGICDLTTGKCSNPAVPDGTSCTDNNSCFNGDSCQAGVCAIGTPVACLAIDECHDIGVCESTGKCSNPAKTDGAACSGGGTCEAGTCQIPDAGLPGSGGMGGSGVVASVSGTGGSGIVASSSSGMLAGSGGTGGVAGAGGDIPAQGSGPPISAGGGCGCRVADTGSTGSSLAGLGLFMAVAMMRRRRRA